MFTRIFRKLPEPSVKESSGCHVRVLPPMRLPARGIYLYAHGFRGYARLYASYFIFWRTALNFYVVWIDAPGHGMSGGVPGILEQEELYRALREGLHRALKISRTLPVVLSGYSLGALTIISYLVAGKGAAVYRKMIERGRIFAFIGVGVPFSLVHNVPGWKVTLGQWLLDYSLERFLSLDKADFSVVTHDKKLVRWVEERSKRIYKGELPLRTGYVMNTMAENVTKMQNTFSALIRLFDGRVWLGRGVDDTIAPDYRDFDFVSDLEKAGYITTRLYEKVTMEPDASRYQIQLPASLFQRISESLSMLIPWLRRRDKMEIEDVRFKHELLIGKGVTVVWEDIAQFIEEKLASKKRKV